MMQPRVTNESISDGSGRENIAKFNKEIEMKRVLIYAALILLTVVVTAHATQRLVLGEFFTSTS